MANLLKGMIDGKKHDNVLLIDEKLYASIYSNLKDLSDKEKYKTALKSLNELKNELQSTIDKLEESLISHIKLKCKDPELTKYYIDVFIKYYYKDIEQILLRENKNNISVYYNNPRVKNLFRIFNTKEDCYYGTFANGDIRTYEKFINLKDNNTGYSVVYNKKKEKIFECFIENGVYSKTDGPAVYIKYGNKEIKAYYLKGKLHRTDGPALIVKYGNKISETYYQNGVCNNYTTAPCIVKSPFGKTKHYVVDGHSVTEEMWNLTKKGITTEENLSNIGNLCLDI